MANTSGSRGRRSRYKAQGRVAPRVCLNGSHKILVSCLETNNMPKDPKFNSLHVAPWVGRDGRSTYTLFGLAENGSAWRFNGQAWIQIGVNHDLKTNSLRD